MHRFFSLSRYSSKDVRSVHSNRSERSTVRKVEEAGPIFSPALLARSAICDTDHGFLLTRAVMEFVCNFRTRLAFQRNVFYINLLFPSFY